jgi:DNA-binding transcriptional LysR family regulator
VYDWSDLRFFLAVSRSGSALAAARTLGVNQTTVTRRLEALEQSLGVRLFERGQTGSRLTEAGAALLASAEAVERAAEATAAMAAAHQRGLTGVVRVTTNESLANLMVMPALAEFRRLYPDIKVDVIVLDRFLDLTKGEADVAIRGTVGVPDGNLVGRKLFDADWALYCSRDYAKAHGCPRSADDLPRHAVIGAEGDLAEAPVFAWIDQIVPKAAIQCRSNTVLNLTHATKAGLGVAALPILMGAVNEDLVRCFVPDQRFGASVWILTTAELKSAPRVRAFIDFITPKAVALARAVIDEADRRQPPELQVSGSGEL